MSMKTKSTLALLGGVLMLSLAACAPNTGAGEGAEIGGEAGAGSKPSASQTQEEACEVVGTEFAAYAQAITEKYDALDPAEFTTELLVEDQKASLEEMNRIVGLVANEDVKTAFTEVIDASRASIPLMEKLISDPTAATEIMASEEYTTLQTRNTEAADAFEAVCPGALVAATPPAQ